MLDDPQHPTSPLDPTRAVALAPTDAGPEHYRALPDVELLQVVLQRDEAAWKELMRRFRPLIFRCLGKVAFRYEAVLANEDANEIFSEVCFNLLRDDMRKLRAWDPARGSKLGSWLGLIAMNTAYDFLRVTRRRPLLDKLDGAPERPAPGPSALDELIEKERWSTLRGMLSDFSDKDRRFVELYYGQGLLPDEVAVAMRISVKTVYSKKNKLRNKLEALAQGGVTDGPDGTRARAQRAVKPARVRRIVRRREPVAA